MNDTKKIIDPIPEEFGSYEEAAEFCDTHDTTDYPELFHHVETEAELRKRHYEVEIDEDLVNVLRESAQKRGIPISHLVSSMLRNQISSSQSSQ